jgi:hypothetical protein
VSTAADVGGNLASIGLGALFAGADGAVAGAFVGPTLATALRSATEQISGWIGGRQAERVSEAIRTAALDIQDYCAQGHSVREDFLGGGSGSVAAEEIAEGLLQTVAFSYEQRKAPYLGHLLASVAVRPDISVADAHHLISLVDRFSYRQLVTLAAIGAGLVRRDALAAGTVLTRRRMGRALAVELEELSSTYGLVGETGTDEEDSTFTGLIETRRLPLDLSLLDQGRFLFELMRLDTVPQAEQIEALRELLGIEDLDGPVLRAQP